MTKNRKAVSPVIATVVLVAVAITIAVAVSYWMSGISSQYTRFEKVELTSAHCQYHDNLTETWDESVFESNETGWVITLDFRNTGTTEAAIINAFVNSKKIADYGNTTNDCCCISAWEDEATRIDFSNKEKVTCVAGKDDTIYIVIVDDDNIDFSSGTTVEVSLHSGAGNTYMKMITLS
ncbi:MAG: archaellin/type IV pilin N-terminal domain-containing protein [Candidatus Bathyarchaeia archaeon]